MALELASLQTCTQGEFPGIRQGAPTSGGYEV